MHGMAGAFCLGSFSSGSGGFAWQRRRGHLRLLWRVDRLATSLGLLAFQGGIGRAAEQRIQSLHIGDQLQVGGAGFDAFDHLLMQAVDVCVRQFALLLAELPLLLKELACAG